MVPTPKRCPKQWRGEGPGPSRQGPGPIPCLSHPYSDRPAPSSTQTLREPWLQGEGCSAWHALFLVPFSLNTRKSLLGGYCTRLHLHPHPSVLGVRSTACRVVLGGLAGFAQRPRASPIFTGSVASGGSELGVCTGAWGQAASNAGSGVAPAAPGQCRQEGIHQGPEPPGGLSPPTHLTPPGGGAGETPMGPGKRISTYSLAQGWLLHSWKLECGHGWSTHTMGAACGRQGSSFP